MAKIKILDEEFKEIKDRIKIMHDFWKPNFDRFHSTRNFLFRSNLTDDDIAYLKYLKKPQLETNILPTFVFRLLGEFSKQQPSLAVSSDEIHHVEQAAIDTVEGHIRYKLREANNDNFEGNVWLDLLSGGFSSIKLWTDYSSETAFEQDFYFGRCYDPTLCAYDPLAILPHKGDGEDCVELFPYRLEDFKREYPDIPVDNVAFSRELGGFSWRYTDNKGNKYIIKAVYYRKRKKRYKLVELSNGKSLSKKDYDKFVVQWQDAGHLAPPAVIVNERMTTKTIIEKIELIDTHILEGEDTPFRRFPLIFIDGFSLPLRKEASGGMEYFTTPYIYQAMGAQRLMNVAAQTLANELESMVQHKFKVAKESIPEGYEDAFTNMQLPTTVVYNQFQPENPDRELNPPQEIIRTPMPQEVFATFQTCPQIIQTILGASNSALGITDAQISTLTFIESATQSNATAMPYVTGFMQGLTQLGQIIAEVIPTIWLKKRKIPILDGQNKKQSISVNGQGDTKLQYPVDALNVKIEAGVNFNIDKNRTLQQIIAMTKASPVFGQFINEFGLEILLDNMSIRGIDQLKQMVPQFMQQMKQQQAQAAQNNPQMMKVQVDKMKVEAEVEQDQKENELRGHELTIQAQDVTNDSMRIMLEAQAAKQDQVVQMAKTETERAVHGLKIHHEQKDQAHQHAHDNARLMMDLIKLPGINGEE